jgi:hypothetical protein
LATAGEAAEEQLAARMTQLQRQLTELQAELDASTAGSTDEAAPAAAGALAAPRSGSSLSALPVLGSRGQVTSGTAFNPAISVVLDGNYYRDDAKGEFFDTLEHTRGFINPHDHDDHGHAEITPGFNLGHTEIMFSASVDPYFDAVLILGANEHGIEIEEAYALTRALPAGLQLKFGKFLSGIGYLNEQHPHDWDFTDFALPYQLIFGDHGLNEKGVQATWLPPLPVYTLFGLEALQGENKGMAHFEGARDYDIGPGASDKSGPRLFTAFAKVAPDLGFNHALQAGVFGGRSLVHQNLHGSRGEEGETWFAGTDWVYRYDSGRAHGHGNLKLQAEYIYRERDLEVVGVRAGSEGAHPLGEVRRDRQDGFYVQGVYGFAPRWTAGLRYERVGMTNDPGLRSNLPPDVNWAASDRTTANITWMPTEFSRVRLQFARANLADDHQGGRESFDQVYLQYQMALGVHGAHKF